MMKIRKDKKKEEKDDDDDDEGENGSCLLVKWIFLLQRLSFTRSVACVQQAKSFNSNQLQSILRSGKQEMRVLIIIVDHLSFIFSSIFIPLPFNPHNKSRQNCFPFTDINNDIYLFFLLFTQITITVTTCD